jgi:hypothetical protein
MFRPFALALVLATGAIEARADLVTYNMAGTIVSVSSNTSGLPIHLGDRFTWTLQYDRSLPHLNIPGEPYTYAPRSATLFNFVDQTEKLSLPSPPSSPKNLAGLALVLNPGTNVNRGNGEFTTTTMWSDGRTGLFGAASLTLTSYTHRLELPTGNLANFQLNSVPFEVRSLNYGFQVPPSTLPALDFYVQADPLSSHTSSTPEPGSLTLFLLGALGISARYLRARFGQSVPVR